MPAPDANQPSSLGSATVSTEIATKRCATSQWIDEQDWLRAIQAHADLAGSGVTLPELFKRREPLIEAFRAHFQHATVSDEDDDETTPDGWMHMRLAPGTIYKAGPTVRNGMADLLGAILRLLTGSNYFALLVTWTGFASWKLVKTLLDGFERLENPVEREVFEKLFALGGRLAVIDYSALQHCDYDQAYGRIAPTTPEIAADCPTRTLPEVEAALRAMEKREILAQRDGRWSIRF